MRYINLKAIARDASFMFVVKDKKLLRFINSMYSLPLRGTLHLYGEL